MDMYRIYKYWINNWALKNTVSSRRDGYTLFVEQDIIVSGLYIKFKSNNKILLSI